MKKKFISIILALVTCLNLLPTAALAASNGIKNPGSDITDKKIGGIGDTTGDNFNFSIQPHLHNLGDDGKCSGCSSTILVEMTSGETKSYFTNISEMSEALGESAGATFKLLGNVTADSSTNLGFKRANQTIDLNGHTLDTNGGELSMRASYSMDDGSGRLETPTLTITDSSANKNGELKTADVQIYAGSFTINSGKLTAKTDSEGSLVPGEILISGASMTVSGTAKVSCDKISVKGRFDNISKKTYLADLTVEDNAEIVGGITVSDKATLNVSGGKVSLQNIYEADGDVVYVNGGTANISDGNISMLLIENGTLNVSGGTFFDLTVNGGNVLLTGGVYSLIGGSRSEFAMRFIDNGYAYYKCTVSSTTVTRGELIKVTDSVMNNDAPPSGSYSAIMVAPHDCQFTNNTETNKWECACGRGGTKKPVKYLDKNGNTAYCLDYEVLTESAGGSSDISGEGWCVLDKNISCDKLKATVGDFNLILSDNATLTLDSGIILNEDGDFNVYGQSNGDKAGKIVINGKDDNGGAVIVKDNMTVNGGDITVNTNCAVNDFSYSGIEISDIETGTHSVAVAGNLTVNGGKLTVNAPNNSNARDGFYGVYVGDELTVNGGKIGVTCGDMVGNGANLKSIGIYCTKLTMTGGEVDSTAAKVTINYTGGDYNYSSDSVSKGVYVDGNWTDYSTGIANIIGGKLTATAKNATNTGYNYFMGSYSYGFEAFRELIVENATVKAVSGNAVVTANAPEDWKKDNQIESAAYSIGIYTGLTAKSGATVTATAGTANITGADEFECVVNDIDAYDISVLGGTITDNVVIDVHSLNVESGTIKLNKDSYFDTAKVSDNMKIADLLSKGCAYFEVEYIWDEETYDYIERDVGFVTLGDLTALNEEENSAFYVRTCTHSTKSGMCNYCGTKVGSSKPNQSAPGGAAEEEYEISVSETVNGSVKLGTSQAVSGETVTFTVTPDSGYVLKKLTVSDSSGNEIAVTDNGDGKYSFTMPEGNAAVKAEFAAASSFADVSEGAYFYEAVMWATQNGITDGVGGEKFGPKLDCTRAQVVTFLWRAAGSPEPKNAADFSDINANGFYAKAVAWAVENGIVNGIGNNRFAPNETVTREQVAVMLYRFAKLNGIEIDKNGINADGFADFKNISAYAADAMQWAVESGILQGYNNNLTPEQACVRGQIVTVLYRLLVQQK